MTYDSLILLVFSGMSLILSICIHKHKEPQLHQLCERTYVLSLVWAMLLSLIVIVFFNFEGLQFLKDAHKCFVEIERQYSKEFPLLIKLSISIIGIFIAFLLLRPKLYCHPIVAYNDTDKKLMFHIHNNSLFHAINTKVEASFFKIENEGAGDRYVVHKFDLENNDIPYLSWIFGHDNQRSFEVCTLGKSEDKNEEVLSYLEKKEIDCEIYDGIELRIIATHPVSRNTAIFTRCFYCNDILNGYFDNRKFMGVDRNGDAQKYTNNQYRRDLTCKISHCIMLVTLLLTLVYTMISIVNPELVGCWSTVIIKGSIILTWVCQWLTAILGYYEQSKFNLQYTYLPYVNVRNNN